VWPLPCLDHDDRRSNDIREHGELEVDRLHRVDELHENRRLKRSQKEDPDGDDQQRSGCNGDQ
jgi:hypothetical protein